MKLSITIFSVIEDIAGRPSVTSFLTRSAAAEHFKEVLEEHFGESKGDYAGEIAGAIERERYSGDDYNVDITETDLCGTVGDFIRHRLAVADKLDAS